MTVIGYTAGVFDILHMGHINILRNAKAVCDYLIVGVTTDQLAEEAKGKRPVQLFEERIEIVRSLRFVDAAIPQDTYDKTALHERLKFDVMIVGDDWFGKWEKWEGALKGVRIIYFPRTGGVSSTKLRGKLARGGGC
jgi:glycerol-3-phosphate cytidylyltransferase